MVIISHPVSFQEFKISECFFDMKYKIETYHGHICNAPDIATAFLYMCVHFQILDSLTSKQSSVRFAC